MGSRSASSLSPTTSILPSTTQINREQIGRVDAIVGCGDLEPGYLGFLGDAFGVRVAYVRGNHDRGGHWSESPTTLRLTCRAVESSASMV